MKKLKQSKTYKYSVHAEGRMKEGTMTNIECHMPNGVTLIIVAEGWLAGEAIDKTLAELNAMIDKVNYEKPL